MWKVVVTCEFSKRLAKHCSTYVVCRQATKRNAHERHHTMARSTQVLLIDDIDGDEATETITFTFEGVAYEIDLNAKNAEKFRSSMEVWTTNGRRVGGRSNRGTKRNSEIPKIRQWAKENGYEVSERGRVSQEIQDAYRASK